MARSLGEAHAGRVKKRIIGGFVELRPGGPKRSAAAEASVGPDLADRVP